IRESHKSDGDRAIISKLPSPGLLSQLRIAEGHVISDARPRAPIACTSRQRQQAAKGDRDDHVAHHCLPQSKRSTSSSPLLKRVEWKSKTHIFVHDVVQFFFRVVSWASSQSSTSRCV